jgi:hypothetical protein
MKEINDWWRWEIEKDQIGQAQELVKRVQVK